jgi:5'-nucleotidase
MSRDRPRGKRAPARPRGPRPAATPSTMRFLCTNDDGVMAQGLDCLVRAAGMLGAVTVVAPDREQSASSHSLTLHYPLRARQRPDGRHQVDGTPTDCVMLAVEALMPERPHFVLSGVNHGQNMGEDVLYSGTVAAAMEGLALGIPSIAFSFAGGDHGTDPSLVTTQVEAITALLRHFVSLTELPPDTLFNVNLPPVPGSQIKGLRLTRLGRRVFSDSLTRMHDPWGKEIFWIGGGTIAWSGGPDSDFRAIQDGYISVTPLHLDLTHFDMLRSADQWWREP